jgi:HK97 family phage major capsid protein
MDKQTYKNQRNAMLAEADALIQDGKLKESEAKMNEIKKLDVEFANKKSLETDHGVMDLASKSVKIEGGKVVEATTGAFAISDDNQKHKLYFKNDKLSTKTPDHKNLSLGKYLKGAITGDWKGAPNERLEFQALSTATASVMIPEILSNQVIDLARNKSIFFQSNVPMIDMESNNLTISKVATDPVFGFKAEGAPATESTMTFEAVRLQSKTCYGLMSITLEALQSSANLEEVVRNTMAEALAQTIDRAFLYGDGINEPAGVLTNPDINAITGGAIENFDPFVKAVGAVRRGNGDATTWALNATTDEELNMLKDTTSQPLNSPDVLDGLDKIISNQLLDNEGVGLNESTSIIYDPTSMIIGMQSPISVELSREANDAYQKGIVYLRVYCMTDIQLLQPKWFSKVTGLTPVVTLEEPVTVGADFTDVTADKMNKGKGRTKF